MNAICSLKLIKYWHLNFFFRPKMSNFVQPFKTLLNMKRIGILIAFLIMIANIQAQDSQSDKTTIVSFGNKISSQQVLSVENMTAKYQKMSVNDSLQLKFKAVVTEVCQSSGCWMKLELANGEQSMVRFKDYGFFMPKDIAGKEVIVRGKAFVEQMSITEQKHFAQDAGQSDEEIAKITELKKTFSFEADGVLLEQ